MYDLYSLDFYKNNAKTFSAVPEYFYVKDLGTHVPYAPLMSDDNE